MSALSPCCNSEGRVYNTRKVDGGVKRALRCIACDKPYSTIEIVVPEGMRPAALAVRLNRSAEAARRAANKKPRKKKPRKFWVVCWRGTITRDVGRASILADSATLAKKKYETEHPMRNVYSVNEDNIYG